ncbi:MAG: hypothetical protein AAB438_01895 [Patescibacteria group bacterium]
MFTKILIFVVILVGIIFGMMDFYDRNGKGEEYDFVKFFKNLFK